MANYRPLRLCKCGKCECDLGTIQEQDREEDKLHQFLFGRGNSNGMARRGRGGSTSFANAVHVNEQAGYESANYMVTDKDKDEVNRIIDSQWRAIKSLLNARKSHESEKITGTSSLHFWIMDTCASHSLTGRLDILTDVRDIEPVGVVLDDGRERMSIKEGFVWFEGNLPIELWGECVLTVSYLINRNPSMVLNEMTPYEQMYHEKHAYCNARVLKLFSVWSYRSFL